MLGKRAPLAPIPGFLTPTQAAPFPINQPLYPPPPITKKIKKEKKKLVRCFKIGNDESPNMMEDLIQDPHIYKSLFYTPYSRPFLNPTEAETTRNIVKEMKESPWKFFNFRMNYYEYISYVRKMYFMRLEREIIRKAIEKA